ncbi:MAG: DUF6880 family protein [Cyanobacteria bacterium J06639_1]
MSSFSEILDEELLVNLAGERSFERGQDYFESGAVHSLAEIGDRIVADVSGTETYHVQIWLRGEGIDSRCTCPMGVDGYFCKHCVAVGLAWIDEPPPYQPDGIVTHSGTTMADVRDFLGRQERDVLVKLILDRAMEDTRWRENLLMKAAASHTGGADIKTFRRALQNAIPIGEFVDYYAADGYADEVQQAVDGLETLIEMGYASDVVELCEEAIAMLDDALNSIDDSNGNMSPIMEQVQDLHLRACKIAKPNPSALAERLLDIELESGFGFFHNALEIYADVLGDEGIQAYRQLVDADWERLSPIGSERKEYYDFRRMKLNQLKEALVETTGTLEELVETISNDLSRPDRYLKIAELYRDRGNPDEAIAWAERGTNEFQGSNSTYRLEDCLVNLYERQGQFEDAVEIIWQRFIRLPSVRGYQQLKQHADSGGTWTGWRDRAIAHVKQAYAKSPHAPYYWGQKGHSLLVGIYLWEEKIEDAWRAAQNGNCSQQLWMQLAEARAINVPEDAIAIYQPAIEPLIKQTDNKAYKQAVKLLEKVRNILERLDRGAEFDAYAKQLSESYKRKRNFIKLLIQHNML